jgi:tRNA(Glu) U13 pseudouridine synthase TruD
MLEFPSAVSAQRTAKQQLQLNFTLRSGTYATVLLREMFANVIDAAAMGQNRECDQEADEEFTEGPE